MSSVGVVGLGTMGSGIALNLREGGHDVVVHDADPAARDRTTDQGLLWRASAAEVAAACAQVVLSVPGPDDVRTVVAGPGGLVEGWSGTTGAVVIDLSTIGPVAAREMHATCAGHGVAYVEAAVSGGPHEVRTGTAGLFLAGDDDALASVRPLVDRIAQTAEVFGPPGSAQAAKVGLNAFYGAFQAGLAECLAQLGAGGVDIEAFQRVLAPVDYREWVDLTADAYREGRSDGGFRMDLLLKDLRLALAARDDLGTASAVTAATITEVKRACALGHGTSGVAALASTLGPSSPGGTGR